MLRLAERGGRVLMDLGWGMYAYRVETERAQMKRKTRVRWIKREVRPHWGKPEIKIESTERGEPVA